jgi:hypothetical protein
VFWPTLRRGLRAGLDANSPTIQAVRDATGRVVRSAIERYPYLEDELIGPWVL